MKFSGWSIVELNNRIPLDAVYPIEFGAMLCDYAEVVADGNIIDLEEFFDGYSLATWDDFSETEKGEILYTRDGNKIICSGNVPEEDEFGNPLLEDIHGELYSLGTVYREPFIHELLEEDIFDDDEDNDDDADCCTDKFYASDDEGIEEWEQQVLTALLDKDEDPEFKRFIRGGQHW